MIIHNNVKERILGVFYTELIGNFLLFFMETNYWNAFHNRKPLFLFCCQTLKIWTLKNRLMQIFFGNKHHFIFLFFIFLILITRFSYISFNSNSFNTLYCYHSFRPNVFLETWSRFIDSISL